MFNLGTTINKKVVAIKALQLDKRRKTGLEPKYILFNDKLTIIEFDEQDYYCFHDCSSTARNILVLRDAEKWKRIFNNENGIYPDANCDI